MSFVRYTTKKILINAALLYTLVPMVKPHIKAGVTNKSVIKCVRWVIAYLGAFYIYGKIFEKFWDFSIFLGKMAVLATKGTVECFRERLSGRGEVIPLRLTKQEQDIVRRKFGKYCIAVLNGEAQNYLEELDRLWEQEINFSDLREDVLNQLCSYNEYSETEYFQIMGMKVPVRDGAISDALYRLPEKKRKIILMAYFLDMTEKEIAEYMNLVQSTVHYHKAESLRLLKKILE